MATIAPLVFNQIQYENVIGKNFLKAYQGLYAFAGLENLIRGTKQAITVLYDYSKHIFCKLPTNKNKN